jgi:hypothetical protein
LVRSFITHVNDPIDEGELTSTEEPGVSSRRVL